MGGSMSASLHSDQAHEGLEVLGFLPHSSSRVRYTRFHRHCILTHYLSEISMQHTLQPVAALMMDEAREFEILDALPPFDDYGNVAWQFEGAPTTRREKRWLELYTKLSAKSPVSPRSLGPSLKN